MLVLLFYACICFFKAPVCRAVFQHIIQKVSLHQQWNLNKVETQLFAFCCCLALFPNLWTSLSLAMSSSICIALHITKKSWLKPLLIYFVIFVFISGYGSPHPISLFVNLVFSPLFASLYFPITGLQLFFDFLNPVFDFLWLGLFYVLEQLKLETLPQQERLSSLKSWMFLAFLFLIFNIKTHWTKYREIKDF